MKNKRPAVGFISPPAWFDPAPAEFPRVCVEEVRTQQASLPLPDFDYKLGSIASIQDELNLCARTLRAAGCDLIAQIGSPFAWACALSEKEARDRCDAIADAAGIPALMTGLAIVDGLRALCARRVAVACTYYEADWRDGFANFIRLCGFETIHVATLADQRLIAASATMEDYGWSMTPELTRKSVGFVADAAPDAEAIVVTGAGTRTIELLVELEANAGRPIVAADTVLYWAIARELGLSLRPILGALSKT